MLPPWTRWHWDSQHRDAPSVIQDCPCAHDWQSVIERSASRKALIARYGYYIRINFPLIESDAHDPAPSHEQTVGMNILSTPLSGFGVSGSAGINRMTFCELWRAACRFSPGFVNKMTLSQAIQASIMCEVHSKVDVGSPILNRAGVFQKTLVKASDCAS